MYASTQQKCAAHGEPIVHTKHMYDIPLNHYNNVKKEGKGKYITHLVCMEDPSVLSLEHNTARETKNQILYIVVFFCPQIPLKAGNNTKPIQNVLQPLSDPDV